MTAAGLSADIQYSAGIQHSAGSSQRRTKHGRKPRSKRGVTSGVASAAGDATNAARPTSLLDVAPLTWAGADTQFHAAADAEKAGAGVERWSGRVRRWSGGTTMGRGESGQVTVHACHPAAIVGGRRQAVFTRQRPQKRHAMLRRRLGHRSRLPPSRRQGGAPSRTWLRRKCWRASVTPRQWLTSCPPRPAGSRGHPPRRLGSSGERGHSPPKVVSIFCENSS